VFGHEYSQTPLFPLHATLPCEANQFAAKALLKLALAQKFVEQIVGDLLVMNSGCEPRRNQRSPQIRVFATKKHKSSNRLG
jgi:hypothetical protein